VSQEIAKDALGEGYEFQVAMDGQQALTFLSNAIRTKERLPDAVLLDMTMPGMSGLEVCAEIKKLSEQVKHVLPIIIISARSMGDVHNATESCRPWIFDYISKPFNADCLKTKVSAAVRASRAENYSEARNNATTPTATTTTSTPSTNATAAPSSAPSGVAGPASDVAKEAQKMQAALKEAEAERDTLRQQLEDMQRQLEAKQAESEAQTAARAKELQQRQEEQEQQQQQKQQQQSKMQMQEQEERSRLQQQQQQQHQQQQQQQEREALQQQVALLQKELYTLRAGASATSHSLTEVNVKEASECEAQSKRIVTQRQVIQRMIRQLIQAKGALKAAGVRLDVTTKFAEGCQDLLTFMSANSPSSVFCETGDASSECLQASRNPLVAVGPLSQTSASLLASHLDIMRHVLQQSRSLVMAQDEQLCLHSGSPGHSTCGDLTAPSFEEEDPLPQPFLG